MTSADPLLRNALRTTQVHATLVAGIAEQILGKVDPGKSC
jgi:hypothetical protein